MIRRIENFMDKNMLYIVIAITLFAFTLSYVFGPGDNVPLKITFSSLVTTITLQVFLLAVMLFYVVLSKKRTRKF